MIDQINQNVGTVGWIDSLAKGGGGYVVPCIPADPARKEVPKGK